MVVQAYLQGNRLVGYSKYLVHCNKESVAAEKIHVSSGLEDGAQVSIQVSNITIDKAV